MGVIYIWFIAYIVPTFLVGGLIKILPRNKKAIRLSIAMMHVALLISIATSQYFIYIAGLSFPWYPHVLSVAAYLVGVLVAVYLVGRLGMLYAISAFLQQLTLLSIASLLLTALPAYWVILLEVPMFTWCHVLQNRHWLLRMTLLTLWGCTSIILFSVWRDVYIIAALHTVAGSFLISRSILNPDTEKIAFI